MLKIIQKRKLWFTVSGIFCLISIIALSVWGLNFGIDFTGGTLMELSFSGEDGTRPEIQAVKEALNSLELGEINIQPSGENNLLLRMKAIDETTHQNILSALNEKFTIEEKRFESIGPVIGQELKRKAIYAIVIALVAIICYIAWAFRKVSYPVASWKYGTVATITLFHDILIVLGIFSILGHFQNVEIGTPFIAALLTILGYSVNDTIVVFDRIRENLARSPANTFEETVNKGVNETLVRSLNTSLTTLFVLLAIYFFGGETIKYFALALIIGIISGTYSSIFTASPLLVSWQRWNKRKNI